MSERLVWILGRALWIGTFLVVSLIIYFLLKVFPNILPNLTYLQVCTGHLLIRILKADLPVETLPSLFQQKQVGDVQKHLIELEEQIKKLKI
tara:strand:- start:187 stop:462 length:276 start_codon:yes stop_codon:yes gene_type:complete